MLGHKKWKYYDDCKLVCICKRSNAKGYLTHILVDIKSVVPALWKAERLDSLIKIYNHRLV